MKQKGRACRQAGFAPILILLIVMIVAAILFLPIPYYAQKTLCKPCPETSACFCPQEGWHLGDSLWKSILDHFKYLPDGSGNKFITPFPKACTMEAKICPDGSSVGRTGSNCEFYPCPTSTQTQDGITNWKTYATSVYSIKYPNTWLAKADTSVAGLEQIYDPNSMQNRSGSGAKTVSYPTKFVNIVTIPSTDTTKQYVDKMTVNNPAYTGIQTERRTISIKDLSAEIYKEAGEGSRGYDIVVSNGSEIIRLNVPTSDPTADPIINQILSTFKFLK